MTTETANPLEQLPGLDDILGVSQKAELYVTALRSIAQQAANFKIAQLADGSSDGDQIPGTDRTYAEQRKLAEDGVVSIWDEVDREGLRANVEQLLKDQRK